MKFGQNQTTAIKEWRIIIYMDYLKGNEYTVSMSLQKIYPKNDAVCVSSSEILQTLVSFLHVHTVRKLVCIRNEENVYIL